MVLGIKILGRLSIRVNLCQSGRHNSRTLGNGDWLSTTSRTQINRKVKFNKHFMETAKSSTSPDYTNIVAQSQFQNSHKWDSLHSSSGTGTLLSTKESPRNQTDWLRGQCHLHASCTTVNNSTGVWQSHYWQVVRMTIFGSFVTLQSLDILVPNHLQQFRIR